MCIRDSLQCHHNVGVVKAPRRCVPDNDKRKRLSAVLQFLHAIQDTAAGSFHDTNIMVTLEEYKVTDEDVYKRQRPVSPRLFPRR